MKKNGIYYTYNFPYMNINMKLYFNIQPNIGLQYKPKGNLHTDRVDLIFFLIC